MNCIFVVQPLLFSLNRHTREMVELHLYGSTNSFKLEPAQKISGWTTSVRLSYFSLFIKSGPRFPGWCATNVDKNGKIREVGLCADSCMSEATNIDFTSINLLTQDECKYIFELSKYLVSLNKSETGVFQRRGGGVQLDGIIIEKLQM